jgi:hypothetical protein
MLRAFGSCFRRLSCINRSSNFCLEQVGFGLKIKNSLPLVQCKPKRSFSNRMMMKEAVNERGFYPTRFEPVIWLAIGSD